jgi:hypothetical protein
MYYPQTARDALKHLSDLPYFDAPGLGNGNGGMPITGGYGGLIDFAVKGAAAAYGASEERGAGEANTNTGQGMPGGNQSVPRQPSALSTISTAVVTQVSPQISPVMTQQQSSPGATVGANPMQFMPGGLSADQGMTPYGNFGMPGFPTNSAGISPMQPYTLDPRTGQPIAIDPRTGQPIQGGYLSPGGQYSPVSVGGASMTDFPWIPIAIVGGAVALAFMLKKPRRV